MVRKCAVLLFAVVVGRSAAAQEAAYQYIVPITGNVESAGGIFYSYTRLINLTSRGASVSLKVFPANAHDRTRCNPAPFGLAAGQFTTLGQACDDVYALQIASTEPLYVRSEVESYTRARFLEGPHEEPIPVATSFFAAGDTVLIPDVPADSAVRANLVIVNPEPVSLTATVRGLRAGDPSMTVEVAAESMRLVPVTHLAVAGDPITRARHYLVSADGRFQAGVSAVVDDGRASYRAAVVVPIPAP